MVTMHPGSAAPRQFHGVGTSPVPPRQSISMGTGPISPRQSHGLDTSPYDISPMAWAQIQYHHVSPMYRLKPGTITSVPCTGSSPVPPRQSHGISASLVRPRQSQGLESPPDGCRAGGFDFKSSIHPLCLSPGMPCIL